MGCSCDICHGEPEHLSHEQSLAALADSLFCPVMPGDTQVCACARMHARMHVRMCVHSPLGTLLFERFFAVSCWLMGRVRVNFTWLLCY